MRIFRRLRRRPKLTVAEPAPAPPPSPGRPTYEETRVGSAILAFLANERPAGATVPELSLALDFDRETIRAAVDQLVRLEIVTETAGQVLLGPPAASDDQARLN